MITFWTSAVMKQNNHTSPNDFHLVVLCFFLWATRLLILLKKGCLVNFLDISDNFVSDNFEHWWPPVCCLLVPLTLKRYTKNIFQEEKSSIVKVVLFIFKWCKNLHNGAKEKEWTDDTVVQFPNIICTIEQFESLYRKTIAQTNK